MELVKNLAEVSIEEQRKFLNSFDHIFCDMDGVIWYNYEPLKGANICLNHLKKIGKKLTYVTNNSFSSRDTIYSKLSESNFDTDNTEVVNPTYAIISYLKSINFNKLIYIIGTNELKNEFKKSGFSLFPDLPYIDTLTEFVENVDDDPSVGAVIINFDFNMTRLKLQKALVFLQRKDCLFIIGACEKELPIGPDVDPLMGTKHFAKCLADMSEREFLQLSKPSPNLLKFLTKQLGIENSNRVLMIGDSIPSDMGLAAGAGYQKLLVLSGVTKLEKLQNWQYPENFKPDYYIDSLERLNDVLKLVSKY